MTDLDIDVVRAQFPAFREPAIQGQAFFENAGGSYPCIQVIDRLSRYYRSHRVQPYAPYRASQLAGQEMDEARRRMAAILNVDEDELHFGPSTSQNSYVLARAFAGMLQPGDAIVVTNQDHEANSGAWRRLAADGFEIREWRIDPSTGHLDPAGLERLLDERVRLVAFPHCSNILGEINPVAAICQTIREAGAWSCVDGVSYAPHGFPDVQALGADIYLFSSYKTYGPHQGLMIVRRELAARLPNQGHYFNADSLTKRLTPAGPDHAQIAACAGMADYIETLHAKALRDPGADHGPARAVHGAMRGREIFLMRPLLDYLRGRNDIRLLGPDRAESRAPTIAIAHDRPGEALAADLSAHGIMAGGGHFYAHRLVEALGIDPEHGVLRMSFTHYTSETEIGQLIEALDRVL